MKTNKFTSSIKTVFAKSSPETVMKIIEPQDLVIMYDTESQKKEKTLNELKSFISNNSRNSFKPGDNRVLLSYNFYSPSYLKSLSRLVYFYNLTNPDNFEMFKKNVNDGYLLLMLLNMRTVVSYTKVPEDTRELQTKGIKNFIKLFTRKQWKNLITTEPFLVLNFESIISNFITSSFSETFFEDNGEIRFYFELLKSVLDHESLTYYTSSMINIISSTIVAELKDPRNKLVNWEKTKTLDEFAINFYGSIDIFTGLLSLYRRLSPDLNISEIRDHIVLMTEIRCLNRDVKFQVNPNWSILRIRKEHHNLVTMLNDLKSVQLSKRPINNLKFINYENLNNVVLTNEKGIDYEISIKLLNTELELHEETNIMKHCVSTYYTRAKQQNYLVFSVATRNSKDDRYTVGFSPNYETEYKNNPRNVVEGRENLDIYAYQINIGNNIKDFSLDQVKGKFNGSVSNDFPLNKLLELLYKTVNDEKFIAYLNGKKSRPLTSLKSFENTILWERKTKSKNGALLDGVVVRGNLCVFKNSPFNVRAVNTWGDFSNGFSDFNNRVYSNQWMDIGPTKLKGKQKEEYVKEYLDIFLKATDVFRYNYTGNAPFMTNNRHGLELKQTCRIIYDRSKFLTVTTPTPLIMVTVFEDSMRPSSNTLIDVLINGI